MSTLRAVCLIVAGTLAAFAQYQLGDVHVTVLDDSGERVGGAAVHCVSRHYGPRATRIQPDEQGTTDSQGHVKFHDKFLGQSFVRVMHGKLGGWFRIQDNKDGVSFGTVTIGLGRTVRGKITDEQGEPLAGVLVSVDGCLPAAETDAQGNYAVPNIGIGNTYSFGYYKEGYAWVSESPRDDMKSVDITLKKGVNLEGIVIGPDEKPVANAEVFGANRNDPVRTGEDGTFLIYGLPVNTDVELRANYYQQEPYLSGETELRVGDSPPPAVTIALAVRERKPYVPRTITGTVVRADSGKPVTARMFMGHTPQYADSNPGATDPQGVFLIDNNVQGIRYISALPINPTLYVVGEPLAVDVSEGSVENVVLKVADGCAIRGRAITEDGKPVANRFVNVSPRSPFFPQINTREDGRFTIPNLEAIGVPHTISIEDEFRRPRSVKVGPLKKGEIREGVEVVLPAAMEPHVLRGRVETPNGEPLANVKVMITYEDKPGKAYLDWPVTDDAGRFEVKVVESGVVKVSASTSVYVNREGDRYDTQQFFKVVGVDTFPLDATKDSEIAIVLEKQGMGVLQGQVVDESGNGIDAQVQIVHGDEKTEYGRGDSGGYFAFQRTPEPPFIIEVTKPEYQARILAIDQSTVDGGTPLAITLKRGPFAIGESVWTAITGQPATDAAVEAMPLSTYIRKNEARYYRMAKETPPEPDAPKPQPYYMPQVKFVDAAGNPITQIVLQPLQSHHSAERAQYVPIDSYLPRTVSSDSGIYAFAGDPTLAYGWVAWAEGMGRVSRQYMQQTPDPNAIVEIEMRPAGSIAFVVTDADGNPAANTPISLSQAAWSQQEEQFAIGVTDTDGKLALTQVAPGTHAFTVGLWRLIVVALGDGENKTVKVRLRTDPDDFDFMLQTWRSGFRSQNDFDAETARYFAELGSAKRSKLAERIRGQIELVSGLSVESELRDMELRMLAGAVVLLKDSGALPALRKALLVKPPSIQRGAPPSHTGFGALARAIESLQGGSAVDFFAEVAANPELDSRARQAAIESIGRIGGDAGLAAFRKLRDDARKLTGAPPAKESYTHGERITETIQLMNLLLSNGARDRSHFAPAEGLLNFNATISEDYKTADVWASFPYGGTNYKMIRIDDEWLISEFGGTAMS